MHNTNRYLISVTYYYASLMINLQKVYIEIRDDQGQWLSYYKCYKNIGWKSIPT